MTFSNDELEVGWMFKHILVPTDLTDRSLKALDIAVKMAFHDASEVTLLHVIEIIQDTECDEFEDFYKKLGKRASRKMEKMVDLYQEGQINIGRQIVFGKRVAAIVNYALENAIDLIVLASHKIDLEDTTQGWGTISYRVGILSHCPILLIK
jgi:nucleotide-binding universal stress UspA family protein